MWILDSVGQEHGDVLRYAEKMRQAALLLEWPTMSFVSDAKQHNLGIMAVCLGSIIAEGTWRVVVFLGCLSREETELVRNARSSTPNDGQPIY